MNKKDYSARLIEIEHMYQVKKMNLHEIAAHFGITHQTINYGLVIANVPRRPRGRPKRLIDPDIIRQLYLTEGLTISQVAKKLKVTFQIVSKEIEKLGIKKRSGGFYRMKYPELNELKVGDTVIIKRPAVKDARACLYAKALNIGIKVSIKSLDKERLQITRVDKKAKN